MPVRSATGLKVLFVCLVIALAISAVLNILLARRVRGLVHGQSARVAEQHLKVGTMVPAFKANRLGGLQEVVSYQDAKQPTVLYVFTPSCVWCFRNIDNLKALLTKAGGEYRFIGLSLTDQGLAEYATKNELKIPVYSGLAPETVKTYKLVGTPQTIVISPEGAVLREWTGAYAGEQETQVETFFHVQLPGIRPIP